MIDDVHLIDYHLQIQASCPHCDEKIIFLNDNIPEKNIVYRTCKCCKSKLRVKPFNIIVEVKKPKKPKKRKNNNVSFHSDHRKQKESELIKKAKKIIKSYGFTSKEIDSVLTNINHSGKTLEQLIQTALAQMDQYEQSKTE